MSGKQRRLHHPGDTFLSRFASAALVLLLLTALPVWFSSQTVTETPMAAPPPQGPEAPAAPTPLKKQDKSPLPVREAVISPEFVPDRPHCLLLIGQDTRDNTQRARSDAMILCSFRKDDPQLTLISFLRDLYVRIPGHPDGRLNTAYALGGMPLLKQTFQENFGIEVDGCIELDFERFVRLVDLLEGISLELRQDEADSITESCTAPIAAGMQLLNGEQALAYVRIRNLDPDSDFSRTERQRKLLHAILDRCRSSSPLTLLKLSGHTLPLLSTDLSKSQLITLTASLLPSLDRLQPRSLRIPADGMFRESTVDGMAVLVADEEKTRQYLADILSVE